MALGPDGSAFVAVAGDEISIVDDPDLIAAALRS